jgi:hypothetical protein
MAHERNFAAMNFLLTPGAPLYREQLWARALDSWRNAAMLVSLEWDAYLAADGDARLDAFAAYEAALDAERAAADELELLHLDRAA